MSITVEYVILCKAAVIWANIIMVPLISTGDKGKVSSIARPREAGNTGMTKKPMTINKNLNIDLLPPEIKLYPTNVNSITVEAVHIRSKRLYAAVLSRITPVTPAPKTPELSIIRPRTETSKGDYPKGVNWALRTIPRLK